MWETNIDGGKSLNIKTNTNHGVQKLKKESFLACITQKAGGGGKTELETAYSLLLVPRSQSCSVFIYIQQWRIKKKKGREREGCAVEGWTFSLSSWCLFLCLLIKVYTRSSNRKKKIHMNNSHQKWCKVQCLVSGKRRTQFSQARQVTVAI